jgi:hypothetical protein
LKAQTFAATGGQDHYCIAASQYALDGLYLERTQLLEAKVSLHCGAHTL